MSLFGYLGSWLRQNFTQHLENFTIVLRRFCQFFFLDCIPNQRPQPLCIRFGMISEQLGQCCIAFQQTVAPPLQLMQPSDMLVRFAAPCFQLGDDGRMILPMYCICRRCAPNLLIRFISRTASNKLSGKSICFSLSALSPTNCSPISCKSCICCLILVLLGGKFNSSGLSL